MSDKNHGPDCKNHGPGCTCDVDEWQQQAIMQALEKSMDAVFSEGGDEERSERLSRILNEYIEQVRDHEINVGQALILMAVVLGRIMITVSPPDMFAVGGVHGQAVIVDVRTQTVIDDPDAELTNPSDVAMLAAWRCLSALHDGDQERAVDMLISLPDHESTLYAVFHFLDMSGRAVIENYYREDILTAEGRELLEKIHAQEEAAQMALTPTIRTDSSSGREFIQLPPEEVTEEVRQHIKERSKGPATYCMTITEPGGDYREVARRAHEEMMHARLTDEPLTLCPYLHWELITMQDMPEPTRVFAEREVRRRKRMRGLDSELLMVWRHTIDCGGQDVIAPLGTSELE